MTRGDRIRPSRGRESERGGMEPELLGGQNQRDGGIEPELSTGKKLATCCHNRHFCHLRKPPNHSLIYFLIGPTHTDQTNDVERQEERGPTNGLACPSSVNEVSLTCEHGLFLFSLGLKQSWFDGTTILVASAALFARMMLTLEGQHR